MSSLRYVKMFKKQFSCFSAISNREFPAKVNLDS